MALKHRKYSPKWSIPQALLTVYEAKKAAENARGVGRNTNAVLLVRGKPKKSLDESSLQFIDAYVDQLRSPNAVFEAANEPIRSHLGL